MGRLTHLPAPCLGGRKIRKRGKLEPPGAKTKGGNCRGGMPEVFNYPPLKRKTSHPCWSLKKKDRGPQKSTRVRWKVLKKRGVNFPKVGQTCGSPKKGLLEKTNKKNHTPNASEKKGGAK